MAALAPVAPGHVPGCAYDVVVEIMLQLDQLLIQGIFGCDPVAEPGYAGIQMASAPVISRNFL